MRVCCVIIVTLSVVTSVGLVHAGSADPSLRSRLPGVTPSLSAAWIAGPAEAGVHFWGGLDLYPRAGRTFFAAVGAEVQFLGSTGRWEVAPTLRMGVAETTDNQLFTVFLQRIPLLKIYGILGWRLPDEGRPDGALRLGIGFSVFEALRLGLIDLLEVGVDVGAEETAFFLRPGFGF
jgi:hypothetical protein